MSKPSVRPNTGVRLGLHFVELLCGRVHTSLDIGFFFSFVGFSVEGGFTFSGFTDAL